MKIKTLLFGAGASAKAYILNCSEDREFIGIIDNDVNKKGQVIEGVVVCGPDELSLFDYSEIVITTQWAVEVEQQLLKELKVPSDKVTTPPKHQLKKQKPPFYDNLSRAFGRSIICDLSDIAIARGVPLVLDFGTLLGIVRDGDIIEWDDDIDMSIPEGGFEDIIAVIDTFISRDKSGVIWSVEKTRDKNGKGMGLVLIFTDPNNALSIFKTTFSVREFKDGNSVHLPSLGMWFSPEHHFRSVETLAWQNSIVQVPAAPEAYLGFVYGDDWRTPKQNITFSDYANTQHVEFDDFIDAGLRVE
jgi:lipopolysaccharide cholinephosphotransferase